MHKNIAKQKMKNLILLVVVALGSCTISTNKDFYWIEIDKLKDCINGKSLNDANKACGVNLALRSQEYVTLKNCLNHQNILRREIRKDHNFSNILFGCENWEASVSYKNGAYPPKIEGVYVVLP